MTVLEILEEARRRHSVPGSWRQGTAEWEEVRKVEDRQTLPACLLIMLIRVSEDDEITSVLHELRAEEEIRAEIGCSISSWNDRKGRTQEDVLALYAKVIARLRAEAAIH